MNGTERRRKSRELEKQGLARVMADAIRCDLWTTGAV